MLTSEANEPTCGRFAATDVEPLQLNGVNFPFAQQQPVMDLPVFGNFPFLPWFTTSFPPSFPSFLPQPPSIYFDGVNFAQILCKPSQEAYENETPIDLSVKPKTEEMENLLAHEQYSSESPSEITDPLICSPRTPETFKMHPLSFSMLNPYLDDASRNFSFDIKNNSEEQTFWPLMNSTPTALSMSPSTLPEPIEMQSLFSYFPFGLDQNMVCPLCRKAFRFEKNLLRHLQKAHSTGNGESILKCKLCPYTTCHYSNMYVHIRTHTGDKPYSCSGCGAAFTQGSSLKLHIKSRHNDNLMYFKLCRKQGKNNLTKLWTRVLKRDLPKYDSKMNSIFSEFHHATMNYLTTAQSAFQLPENIPCFPPPPPPPLAKLFCSSFDVSNDDQSSVSPGTMHSSSSLLDTLMEEIKPVDKAHHRTGGFMVESLTDQILLSDSNPVFSRPQFPAVKHEEFDKIVSPFLSNSS